jgi:hypothetical protein
MCVFTYYEKTIPNPLVKGKGMAGHAWVQCFCVLIP